MTYVFLNRMFEDYITNSNKLRIYHSNELQFQDLIIQISNNCVILKTHKNFTLIHLVKGSIRERSHFA